MTNERLAILFIGVGDGKQIDLIRLLDISSCAYTPIKIAEFPASFFTMENYNTSPYIQNFTYDGYYLFILNSYTRNDGFGHMYVFNTDTFNASLKVNPIDGTCCYRDTQFSPDGRYISFVYQPFEAGATSQLYYIPFGSVGTGMQYDPVPLPDTFFQDPRVKPLPVLRPAQISE
ncbi:MAG: hypothetical protein GWN61_14995 [candidate division Zixibacteria bacterium]|nr:hypothetical protein [candidate division Zixibacteria bacterium]NIS47232.1 hypothetical protein [candidate division Zixibacteria bacterium]NIU15375.1 hypothetical protein [candidate division Zixibacteria bacterium]NIV07440.1 hypothetical protein [candidate division Zixibacteria bacterium]NIW46630.1 hypothetical protein [Gammaproteobacteria bacterium]